MLASFAFLRVAAAAVASDGGGGVIVGDIRVQALSATLLRVEPRGPHGFEDRTTFMVTNRSCWADVPITKRPDGTLSTAFWDLTVRPVADAPPSIVVNSRGGQVLYSSATDTPIPARPDGPQPSPCDGLDEAHCTEPGLSPRQPAHWVCLWHDGTCRELNQKTAPNLLHWPSPLSRSAYSLVDYPRFYVPEWDLQPAPRTVDPALSQTNGYDFENNVQHDTYIFLLGETLESWQAARQEFVKLAGSTPLLPDYAFGTWFTWWHPFDIDDAQSNVSQWEADQLPLDIWGLDMNWRHTEAVQHGSKAQKGQAPGEVGTQDHYYDHPNEQLFPGDGPYGSGFTQWFEWLQTKQLRTYFNDHPFPVAGRGEGGLQTSPQEVAFRWAGLTSWLARGLTFWWFDHNWKLSIPPPFINETLSTYVWEGLDNAAWGSHLYYTTAAQYDKHTRAKKGDHFYERPLSLTKFALPDWRAGMDAIMHQESPAHHRYPVWWTGDGVPLQGSIESMVDAGVHGLKPYVHSDCGGDYTKNGGDLLRWTAHCVFGTVIRYHGADHRPWKYGREIEGSIRQYLKTRYKLAPSLLAAGQHATRTGMPYVARCDLLWPEHAEPPANASVPSSDRNCSVVLTGTDVRDPERAPMPPKGNLSQAQCCDHCVATPTCSAYVWATDGVQPSGYSCFLLRATGGTRPAPNRVVGLVGAQNQTGRQWSSSSTQYHLRVKSMLIGSLDRLRLTTFCDADTDTCCMARYIFLNDTLVAPIWDTSSNVTSRAVWIPPGQWEDAWDGSTVSGPKTVTASQPYERQPMWHRKGGGLTVITDSPGLRIGAGDWSTLVLESFPAAAAAAVVTERSIYALGTAARTDLLMRSGGGDGVVSFDITASEDGVARAWVLRLHLGVGQRATAAVVDGRAMEAVELLHLEPMSAAETASEHFPFGGRGARPPVHAGHIAELSVAPAAHARSIVVTVVSP